MQTGQPFAHQQLNPAKPIVPTSVGLQTLDETQRLLIRAGAFRACDLLRPIEARRLDRPSSRLCISPHTKTSESSSLEGSYLS